MSSLSLSQLQTDLSDPNINVRCRAIYDLGEYGTEQAIQIMLIAMEDPHWKVRMLVAQMSGSLATHKAIPHLIECLQHDVSARVRKECVTALGRIQGELAVEGLCFALTDSSRNVRRSAVQALGTLQDHKAVPALIGVLLTDTDSYVRWDAAQALQKLHALDAIPALMESLTSDENSYVRYAAAAALGTLGSPHAIPSLKHAIQHDENHHVRYAAVCALSLMMEQHKSQITLFEGLLLALNDDNTQVWHAAAEALWTVGEEAMRFVVSRLTHPQHDVRTVALKGVLWLSAEWDDETLLRWVDADEAWLFNNNPSYN
ncbi:MAG: HEAT repeat domain-containing protein [Phototrophicaceae bacterium]